MKRWIIILILTGASLFFYLNFSNANVQLHAVAAELDSTQTQLNSTKTDLTTTRDELVTTKTGLESTAAELAGTETELQATKSDLQSAETELATALDSFDKTLVELDEKENKLAELQINYDGLMTGHGYTIKDPTYNEMMRFLKNDDTDKAKYIQGEYECVEFATHLCNHAEEADIRCGYTTISFPDGRGHTIVAFNTIDKGLIYIEPQHDDLVEIVIGKPFYKCVVPSGNYIYEKPALDDTILKVLVAW